MELLPVPDSAGLSPHRFLPRPCSRLCRHRVFFRRVLILILGLLIGESPFCGVSLSVRCSTKWPYWFDFGFAGEALPNILLILSYLRQNVNSVYAWGGCDRGLLWQ